MVAMHVPMAGGVPPTETHIIMPLRALATMKIPDDYILRTTIDNAEEAALFLSAGGARPVTVSNDMAVVFEARNAGCWL